MATGLGYSRRWSTGKTTRGDCWYPIGQAALQIELEAAKRCCQVISWDLSCIVTYSAYVPVQHSMRLEHLSHSKLSSNEAVQGTQDAASGRYTLELFCAHMVYGWQCVQQRRLRLSFLDCCF